jgi:SAM-dependent methyltransferase
MEAIRNLFNRAGAARAAQAWNDEAHWSDANWWTSPACLAYYNEAVCGRPVTGKSEGCRRRLEDTLGDRILERGVSVGCGTGEKEIGLLTDGLVKHFDLWEIAPRIGEVGTAAAVDAGVGGRVIYRIGNAFKTTPADTYDLVHWDHSLHHMSNVDAALAWSVAVLKPGGFVLINDYVGPNRLQFTRAEVDRMNDFRRRYGVPGKSTYASPISWARQVKRDPSEAPQSERIPAAIARHLPGAPLEPIGGTFLNMLGGVVVPLSRGEDGPMVEALIAEDRKLRDAGGYHFAFALWQKA